MTADRFTIAAPRVPGPRFKYIDVPRPADLEPLPKLPLGLHLVTSRSRKPIRRLVRQMATYFMREFRYSFVQYCEHEILPASDTVAFLWTGGGTWNQAVGGGCFRFRGPEFYVDPIPAHWALQWVWLHPYERGRGRLKEAWPVFRKMFGDFLCERPLSAAMTAFLKRHAPDMLPDTWLARNAPEVAAALTADRPLARPEVAI